MRGHWGGGKGQPGAKAPCIYRVPFAMQARRGGERGRGKGGRGQRRGGKGQPGAKRHTFRVGGGGKG